MRLSSLCSPKLTLTSDPLGLSLCRESPAQNRLCNSRAQGQEQQELPKPGPVRRGRTGTTLAPPEHQLTVSAPRTALTSAMRTSSATSRTVRCTPSLLDQCISYGGPVVLAQSNSSASSPRIRAAMPLLSLVRSSLCAAVLPAKLADRLLTPQSMIRCLCRPRGPCPCCPDTILR